MTDKERIAELEEILESVLDSLNTWHQSVAAARAYQYFEAKKLEDAQ